MNPVIHLLTSGYATACGRDTGAAVINPARVTCALCQATEEYADQAGRARPGARAQLRGRPGPPPGPANYRFPAKPDYRGLNV